jgi:hypothetical protein
VVVDQTMFVPSMVAGRASVAASVYSDAKVPASEDLTTETMPASSSWVWMSSAVPVKMTVKTLRSVLRL